MGVPIVPISIIILLVAIAASVLFIPFPNSRFKTKPGEEWRDYSSLYKCVPKHVHQPFTVFEVAAIVKDAYDKGEKVRVVGAGRSVSAIALTEEHMINLDFMNKVIQIDKVKKTVTVEAGIRLYHLHNILAENNLSVPNGGPDSEQSVGGAISTGTHGTGTEYQSISNMVLAVEIVNGRGDILTFLDDNAILPAIRLSLGALGVITTVTLQLEDARDMRREETVLRVDLMIDHFF